MAVSTGTLLVSQGSTAATSTLTSTLFTPGANHLLVVDMAYAANTADITITDSFTGAVGTWTTVATALLAGATINKQVAWWATAGASPVEGSVQFVVGSGTSLRAVWNIIQCTGQAAAPISEFATGSRNVASLTVDIADYTAGNLVLGFVNSRGCTGVAPGGSGEREISQVIAGAINLMLGQSQDGTDTSHTWTSTLAATTNLGIVMEIAAAATATGTFQLERIERHYPRGYDRGYMRGVL